MAKLTAAEQLELDQLEAEFGNAPVVQQAPGLTPAEEAELATLEAEFGDLPKVPHAPMLSAENAPTEESLKAEFAKFGKQDFYPTPQTSRLEQGAAALMEAGATLNPFTDEIAGGLRSLATGRPASQEIDEVRAAQESLRQRNPRASVAGTVAGIGGSVALGGANLARQAGVNAAQMAGAADNMSLAGRAGMGAVGAALPYAIKGVGSQISKLASPVVNKTSEAVKEITPKVVNSLKSGLDRLGFSASEVREAGKQVLDKSAGSGNPLLQLKTLVDEGVIAGKQSTEELASKLSEVIAKNTSAVNGLIEDPAIGSTLLPTAKSILQLNVNPKQVALRGGADSYQKEAVKILQRNAPGVIDAAGNIKELTLKEAQYLKQGLQALRGDWSKRVDIDDVSKEVITATENHLRDVIEAYSPEIAKLNKVTSAAYGLLDPIKKLEDKGVDVAKGRLQQSFGKVLNSPFTSGAAGAGLGAVIAPTVGLTPREGALTGGIVGGVAKAASYPKALQDSLSVASSKVSANIIPRTVEGIGKFVNDNAAQLSAPLSALLSVFNNASEKEKEAAAPLIAAELEKLGLPVEKSSTGLPSEINGKLTDPVDINKYGKELFKRTDLSIIEKSKQQRLLNATGQISVPSQPAQPNPQLLNNDLVGNPDEKLMQKNR